MTSNFSEDEHNLKVDNVLSDTCIWGVGKTVNLANQIAKSLSMAPQTNETLFLSQTKVVNSLQIDLLLLKAAKHHLGYIFEIHQGLPFIAMLCDVHGTLLVQFGQEELLHEMKRIGIQVGMTLSIDDESPLHAQFTRLADRETSESSNMPLSVFQQWHTITSPILLKQNADPIGYLVFCIHQEVAETEFQFLVSATATAIASCMILEQKNTMTEHLYSLLIQKSDNHVLILDKYHQILKEHHPVHPSPLFAKSIYDIVASAETEMKNEMKIDGQPYWVDCLQIYDHEGVLQYKIGLFKNLSLPKQYEKHLRDIEKLNTLTSLSAGIAHEIRNPLTTARGFLQLFAQRSTSKQDKQFIDLTIAELDRAQNLLTDFMGIAKPKPADRKWINLSDIIQDVAQFLFPEASLENVELTVNIETDPVLVYADVGQMKQVLMNILQNAVHACRQKESRPHGHVQITLNSINHFAQITIQDNGCGIADVSQLFRPFYTTKKTGTGLGLLVSRNIIEEHQGFIYVDTSAGIGTTFRIILPQQEPSVE